MRKPGIWIIATLLCVPIVSLISWKIEVAHADYIERVKTEVGEVNGLYQNIAKMKAADWPRVRAADRLKMAMAGALTVADGAKIVITEIEPLREAGRRVLSEINQQMADPANGTLTFHMIISRIVETRKDELLGVLTE